MTLFGSKSLEDKGSSGPTLSKAEFVEKVRQSNQACHAGDYHRAILLYGEALGVDPQNCILYSNRSAAHMKIQQYDRALDDAIKAQLLNPKWPKVGMSILKHVYGGVCEERRVGALQLQLEGQDYPTKFRNLRVGHDSPSCHHMEGHLHPQPSCLTCLLYLEVDTLGFLNQQRSSFCPTIWVPKWPLG